MSVPKHPAQSRTVWFFLSLLVAALTLPEVIAVIPARYAGIVAALVAVIGLYLRWTTTGPVSLNAPPPAPPAGWDGDPDAIPEDE